MHTAHTHFAPKKDLERGEKKERLRARETRHARLAPLRPGAVPLRGAAGGRPGRVRGRSTQSGAEDTLRHYEDCRIHGPYSRVRKTP